jgi:hypothetical protein
MRFSKTTQTFYPEDIDYPVLPDDITGVSQVEFETAMNRTTGDLLDVINGQMVIIPKLPAILDELKIDRINAITAAFKDALAAGFVTTTGIKMDADITDVQLLKSAYDLMVLLGHTTLPILVDYNNTPHVDMPLHEAIALIIEVAVNYQTLYAKKQTLRGQVMAAANPTELDLITWS